MNQSVPDKEPDALVPRDYPLDADLYSYIAVLMQRAPGAVGFRTGAGRIFRDLLLHWPTLDDWEDEGQELCQRIADAVYPLAAALYAQAVEINITISGGPILSPSHIDAMSSYVVFDAEKRVERHIFLSPQKALPDAKHFTTPKGIVILCRPLNYRYHTIKDDRGRNRGAGADAFGYTEKLINQMLDEPSLIAPDKKVLAMVKSEIKALPKILERAEETKTANLSKETHHSAQAAPVIAAVTSISALPPPVRAFERRLLTYVTDKSLSPDMRLGLRQIAQNLRSIYPQAIIEEAARYQTASPVLKSAPAKPQPKPDIRANVTPKPQATIAPQIKTQPVSHPISSPIAFYATHMSSTPLSVRPSVVLPELPQAQNRTPTVQPAPIQQPVAQSTLTQRPVQHAAPRQEARPASQPASPQQQRRGPEPQAEPARAQTSRQPAPQPEPKQETRPASGQQRTTKSEPQAEPARGQSSQKSAMQPQERSYTPRATERSPRNIPSHHYDWAPDTRPKDFYQQLKTQGTNIFPKATPIAPIGKLVKIVNLKRDKATPNFQAALHKQRLLSSLPTLSLSPFPLSSLFKGKN